MNENRKINYLVGSLRPSIYQSDKGTHLSERCSPLPKERRREPRNPEMSSSRLAAMETDLLSYRDASASFT